VHSFSSMEEFRTFAGDLENITKISQLRWVVCC
jgi:hypothetical protein